MPGWVRANSEFRAPDQDAIDDAVARCTAPFSRRGGDLNEIRETLYTVMWDDVGIIRDAASLARADGLLNELDARLDAVGVDASTRAFNLTWHDWFNLKNLVLVSQSIRFAAMAREDSRGAHYRADYPEVRDLENSRYTCVGWQEGRFTIETRPVKFSRVKPGESLLSAEDAVPA